MKTSRLSVLALLCALMMLSGLLPATAQAAGTPSVKVNGAELIAGASVGCGSGRATYDKASKTLTLDNAVITSNVGIDVQGIDALTIKLVGNSSIAAQARGVYALNTHITFSSDSQENGTLTITSERNLCIDSKSVSVDHATLELTTKIPDNQAISTGREDKGISLINGATMVSNSQINCGGPIIITDSKLVVNNGSKSSALNVTGNLTITGKSNVTVNHTVANSKKAIDCGMGTITIGGTSIVTVTAAGDGSAISCMGGDIEIGDMSTVTAQTQGNGIDIQAGKDIAIQADNVTVSGKAVVKAEGVRGAISCMWGDIEIGDMSTVTAKTAGNYVAVSAKNVTVSGASDVEAEGAGGAISATKNLTISPDAGKLLEMKAGATKDTAAHFTGSPYNTKTSFDATAQPDKSMTYVRIQEHTHAYQWVIDKQPTATEEGLKLEKCDDCGDIRATEPIPATGGGTVDPQPDPPEPPTPPAPPKDDPPVTIPQTGDTTPVALLLAACACACAALLLLRRAKTAR